MPMKPGMRVPGGAVIFTATSASMVPSWKSTPGSGTNPSTPFSRVFTSRTALRPRKSPLSIMRSCATRPFVSLSGNDCSAATTETSVPSRDNPSWLERASVTKAVRSECLTTPATGNVAPGAETASDSIKTLASAAYALF